MDNNEIRKFKCSKCQIPKLVLKKMADQPHHGFACEECYEKRSGHNVCQIG